MSLDASLDDFSEVAGDLQRRKRRADQKRRQHGASFIDHTIITVRGGKSRSLFRDAGSECDLNPYIPRPQALEDPEPPPLYRSNQPRSVHLQEGTEAKVEVFTSPLRHT